MGSPRFFHGESGSKGTEGANRDTFSVERIKEDISYECGLNLCVVSDNISAGTAVNSSLEAQILVREHI
jgi:aspartate-semialdehyde dehydrogenase